MGVRSVGGMSELGDPEAIEPPVADAMVVRLDQILDDFASAVADTSTVSDAVRIDRIARLEKLRAATAALQVAESVRFAQSQVAEQMVRRCASGADWPRYRRAVRIGLPDLTGQRGASAQHRAGVVV